MKTRSDLVRSTSLILLAPAILSLVACLSGGGGGSGDDGRDPTAPSSSSKTTLLAANDLGMHCADLDYQIFSILPPFNVVHAQVIQKGTNGSPPVILNDSQAQVFYSAVADPTGSINTTNDFAVTRVSKTNFWADSGNPIPLSFKSGNNTLGGLTYGPLYPSALAGSQLSPPVDLSGECNIVSPPGDCPSILAIFEPMPVDVGLPVPDVAALASGVLEAHQQNMPGPANAPQPFGRFDVELPFFWGFDFGFQLADVNWWAADGIPIMPVDDWGNPNAYPLMRIAARDRSTGAELAALDVVVPVAAEADCQNCHALLGEGGSNGAATDFASVGTYQDGVTNLVFVSESDAAVP